MTCKSSFKKPKYNSFKMKLRLNILSELFNTWKTSVNWEEYDNYLKKLVAVSKSKKSTGGFLYVPIPNLNLEFSISATEGR